MYVGHRQRVTKGFPAIRGYLNPLSGHMCTVIKLTLHPGVSQLPINVQGSIFCTIQNGQSFCHILCRRVLLK